MHSGEKPDDESGPESERTVASRDRVHSAPTGVDRTHWNESGSHGICRTEVAKLDSTRESFPVGLSGVEDHDLDSSDLASYERIQGGDVAERRCVRVDTRGFAPWRTVREVRPDGG